MASRTSALWIAAALLLLAACRDEKLTSYRVPKEPDPTVPTGAPGDAGGSQAAPDMANTAVPTASGPSLTWTAPASWKAKGLSAMRKGSYSVSGAGGDSDLSITAFPGDVGGELANVNRWRGQVGLAPLEAATLEGAVIRFESNGLGFTVVDLAGAGASDGQQILGAMAPNAGSIWFFKLMGPAATVKKEKAVFLDFLKTVKAQGDVGTAQVVPDMAGTPVATAGGPPLKWTAPAGWRPKPLGAMRKGSYSLVGEGGVEADLSITAFPGGVGGELANINRWRDQVGLPPLEAGQVDGAVARVEANGLRFTVVDFSGTDAANGQRILGAIVPNGGSTWFFKLMGTDAVVGKEKASFMDFLKTVKAPE